MRASAQWFVPGNMDTFFAIPPKPELQNMQVNSAIGRRHAFEMQKLQLISPPTAKSTIKR
jgi:hypothetical protein